MRRPTATDLIPAAPDGAATVGSPHLPTTSPGAALGDAAPGGHPDTPDRLGELLAENRVDLAVGLVAAEQALQSVRRELGIERHRRMAAEQAADMLVDRLMHDPLTRVLSRAGLADAALQVALGDEGPHGLAVLDLGRFKEINDTWGHAAGDHVLWVVAQRIAACMPGPTERVARLGGDEFAVLIPGDLAEALGVAEIIAHEITSTLVEIEPAVSVPVAVSVGVAPLGDSLDAALRHADLAMYWAKALGVRVVTYSPDMAAPPVRRRVRRQMRSVRPCVCVGEGCPGCDEAAA
jgi:diguanylate cyclase (GGDEF)-like protein